MSKLSPNERVAIIEQIVNDYSDDVYYCAYLYLKDRELAKDACQQIFIKVYQNMEKFRHDSNYKTWIMRITANACKSILRSKEYRNSQKETILDERLAILDDSPSDIIEEDQKKELLWKQINTLSPKYREIIILRYYKDYSSQEVAEILRIPQATVRTRLRRAHNLLRNGFMERSDLYAEKNQ